MKRIICILLLVALLVTSLSSCFEQPPVTDPNEDKTDTGTGGSGNNGSGTGGSGNNGSGNNGSGTGGSGTPCADKESHTDTNSDGYCDGCNEYVVVTLDLYAINDLHGKLVDSDTQIGVEELTTYLKEQMANDDESILFSSGDMWQGSAESNMTHGNIITEWMNEMGFVAMALGNHEYDWGEQPIKDNLALADFPFLAINVYDRASGERAEYCSPSVIVERGELKVGIIGAIGDCYSSIAPDKCEDVYFKVGSELTALVKAESNRLRAEGADIIVYTIHDGYGSSSSGTNSISDSSLSSYYASELSRDGYIDVVFEGHSHQNYVLKDSSGVYHLQGGGDNKGISHVELNVNYVTDSVSIDTAAYVRSSTYSALAEDPVVDRLLAKYDEQISPAYRTLGYNSAYRDYDTLCNLVAKLYLELGMTEWSDEYDIVLGGGFLNVRSPYHLLAGEVTYSDLQSLFPFDNQIVLCSIKGRDLKSKFIQTSNSSYYISLGQYGESVANKINDNATYYIVVDSYTSQYKYNNLTVVEEYDPTVFARDLLAAYIEAGGLE